MKQYYLDHKEKIKARSRKWGKDNPGKVRIIQNSYKTKHQEAIRDYYREERIEVIPFEERVSKETLTKMKENTRVNKLYIKNYPWEEDRFIIEVKKRIVEGE